MAAVLLSGTATGALYGGFGQPSPATAQPVARPVGAASVDDRCTALAGMRLANVEITEARLQPANEAVPGAFAPDMTGLGKGPAISGLPAFCRVMARAHPEPGSDIRIEVWLPRDGWNGRFNAVGNGGFAGSISYYEMASAVSAGQASASTDTGHEGIGINSTWAKDNPVKIRDYGWRAVHLMTVNAKQMIAAYYGRPADRSYFMSCSNGGRQALMEASRFPEDYDGIIAGAPAAQLTQVIMSMIWVQQAQMPEGAALKPVQAKLIGDEVRAQCDGVDGQADGSVDDPRQCRIDFARLACGTSSTPQCLTAPQVDALTKIARGPRDARGSQLAYPYSLTGSVKGYPVASLGWEGWVMKGGNQLPMGAIFPRGVLSDFIARPFADSMTFDWNRDPARLVAATAAELDAQPTMRGFFDRGGKLIIWHGWADAAIPAEFTLSFYQDIMRKSGPRARNSVRLFMIPEMQHCFGGNGATSFGQMAAAPQVESPERHIGMAMQQWVENARIPESLIGRKGVMPATAYKPDEKQRLLCSWPKRAMLTAGQDPDQAASYSCRLPDKRD